MTRGGRGKRNKTPSIALSQGWLLHSGSSPSGSSWPEWLSCARHLQRPPSPWEFEAQSSTALEVHLQLSSVPSLVQLLWGSALSSVSWNTGPALQRERQSLSQREAGQMFVFAVRLEAWLLIHTQRIRQCWDGLWKGGCSLGGACQHSWQHLLLCLASQMRTLGLQKILM